MAATIRDVAKAAGVSVATVSRALNGANNVLPGTRQRIEEAAQALRFSPSGAARSLITKSTQTLGALLPDLHGEYFSELIRGIDVAARAHGQHLLLSSSHGDAREAAAALRAMHGRVDGLLVLSPHADPDFLDQNLPGGVPAVLMGTAAGRTPHPSFTVDNYGGARAVMQHFHAQGVRRVAFVAGPAGNFEAAERQRGYREALAELWPGTEPIEFPGDFTESGGAAAGHALLALTERPDAVFAANDMTAIGLHGALQEAGLQLPRDLALAGFDDIPISRYLTPALTTVRVPVVELGRLAVEALVALIGGDINTTQALNTHQQTLEVELMVRPSSQSPGRTQGPN
ncbi:LacI family DNA-binding transcriptional regulator [Burkholderiaceae bacterium UC74_6]